MTDYDEGYEDGYNAASYDLTNDYDKGWADAEKEILVAKHEEYDELLNELHDIFYDYENWPYPLDEMAYDKLNLLFQKHLGKRFTKNDRI